jgi:hypothetical protein
MLCAHNDPVSIAVRLRTRMDCVVVRVQRLGTGFDPSIAGVAALRIWCMDDALWQVQMEALRPVNAGPLVGEAGQWTYNACVNWTGDASELYMEGYRMAAVKLIEQLGHDQDFLVYPIVFLYRHYVELRLKDIITKAGELRTGPSESVPATHNLRKLWGRAEEHLRREYRGCSCHQDFLEDLKASRRLVEELIELDPTTNATTFRYARDSDGRSSLPAHVIRINLQQFAAEMAKLGHFLDGASHDLGVRGEFQRDLEREYRAD